jgi:hypothetical protein
LPTAAAKILRNIGGITSGLLTTRKLAKPFNTSAFVGTKSDRRTDKFRLARHRLTISDRLQAGISICYGQAFGELAGTYPSTAAFIRSLSRF